MLTEQEKRDLALTIAGEVDTRYSPYGQEKTRAEIANILATIENRFDLNTPGVFGEALEPTFDSRTDVVKQPRQYSTWNDTKGERIAKANLAKYQDEIYEAIDDFYAGELSPTAPLASHYWAPKTMQALYGRQNPYWAPAIKDRTQSGPHVFGTDKNLRDDLQILDVDTRIAASNLGAPVPTGKGVSQADHIVRSIMLDPHSGNMGLVEHQETPFHSEYAPGQRNTPKSSIDPSPVENDYPTGPTDPEPWTDSFAPAPEYAPSSASANRFDRSFTVNPAADNQSMGQNVTDHKLDILRLLMQKRMPGMIGGQPGGVPHGFAGTSRLAPDAIGGTTRFLPFPKSRSK